MKRSLGHVALAAAAVLIFHVMTLTVGRVSVGDGLGWDGGGYARMITEGIAEGPDAMQARPLLVLLSRLPYSFGLGILQTFELLNYAYAFCLYLFVALLLERYGVGMRARVAVVCNLALCIATSKMFAFYPVLIDLGAVALMMAAFYFAATDRARVSGVLCVLAAASREFGFAVAIYGMHRSARQRRWRDVLAYVPGIATMLIVRQIAAAGAGTRGPLSIADALGNLAFWTWPPFVTMFLYFMLTVFGGVSALLFLRPAWLIGRLRAEPELASFSLVVVGLTALGNIDIWRYLLFALPAAVLLFAHLVREADERTLGWVLAAMTLITVVTQRPFAVMHERLYFRDWFPLYLMRDALPPDLAFVWAARLAVVVLLMAAAAVTLRQRSMAAAVAE